MNAQKKRWLKKAIVVFAIVALALALFPFAGLKTVTKAAVGDEPAHTKSRTDNGDGTYKLEMTVTGDADVDVQTAANVNVLVILDTSSSMTGNNAGTGTNPPRRADAAEKVVYDFTEALFKYQSSTNPSNIQMALVTFDAYATTTVIQNWTSTKSEIQSHLSSTGTRNSAQLSYHTGTNWQAGLNTGYNDVLVGDGTTAKPGADKDPTFVLFVTDGAPFRRMNDAGTGQVNCDNLTGYQYARTISHTIASYKTGGSSVPADQKGDVTFYGIYAYGEEADYLDDLVYFALNNEERATVNGQTQTTDNYYNASDTESLTKAVTDIFQKIVQALGITETTITDGTTSNVTTSSGVAKLLEVDTSSYEYWLSVPVTASGNNYTTTRKDLVTGTDMTITFAKQTNGTYTATWTDGSNVAHTVTGLEGSIITTVDKTVLKYKWTGKNDLYNFDPPEPSFTNGDVIWNLNDLGTLLDDVTYSITFDVYPSQETYDMIAELKNAENPQTAYNALDTNIKKYLKYVDGAFTLETNTNASLTYKDSRENPSTVHEATFKNPPAVPTVSSTMSIEKSWDPIGEATDITMTVTRDGENFADVSLTSKNNYSAEINISTGLMRVSYDEEDEDVITGVTILDTGHDYAFSEMDDSSYYWDLTAQTVRPMLIDSATVISTLVLIENATTSAALKTEMGEKNYLQKDGKTYFLIEGSVYELSTSSETGHLKAENVKRSQLFLYKDLTGDYPDQKAEFSFDLTVNAAYAEHTVNVTTDTETGAITYVNQDGKTVTVVPDTAHEGLYIANYRIDNGTVVLYGNVADGKFTYKEAMWFSMWDYDAGSLVIMDAPAGWTAEVDASNNKTGYYYAPTGTVLKITNMKATNNIRFGNVPVGTTYTFVETNMPDNYSFDSASQTDTTGTVTAGTRTVEGTVTKSNQNFGVTFVNKYDKAKITATKVWTGDKQETSATVELYQNGNATGKTGTLNADNKWTYTFADLDKQSGGQDIVYTIKETAPTSHYVTTYSGTALVTVTATGATEAVTATISDADGQLGTVTLDADNNWKASTEINYFNEDGSAKTINVTSSPSATLSYTVEDREVVITNEYKPDPTTAQVAVKKTLTSEPEGLTLPDITEEYTFVLAADNESNATGVVSPMPTLDPSVKNPDADGGTATFGAITFEAPGTYHYKVTESGTVAGVTNDSAASTGKAVTITVVDNNGSLAATVSPTTVEFTNTYKVGSTTVEFPVKKVLELNGLSGPSEWSYEINLTAAEGTPMPTTTSGTVDQDTDTVTFGPITYTVPGTYTYTVAEDGSIDGVTNDKDADGKTVTVTVVDNGNGTMTATASSTAASPLTFTNEYKVTETTAEIPVKKNVVSATGLTPADITGKFTFTLAAVTDGAPMPTTTTVVCGASGEIVKFPEITYTTAGTFEYTITESVTEGKTAGGIDLETTEPKTISVVVTDNKDGTLTAVVNGGKELEFNNPYTVTAIDVVIPVEKILSAPEGVTKPDITNKFKFTIATTNSAPLPATKEITNPSATGGNMTFGDEATTGKITISAPGVYKYTITESGSVAGVINDENATQAVTVTVTDKGDGTLEYTLDTEKITFTNTYDVTPVTATIPIEKILEVDEALTAPDITEKFTFTLEAVTEGAPMPEVTSYQNPDADGGDMTFGTITYKKPGTYNYKVTETGEVAGVSAVGTTEKTVTVVVDDSKADGSMTVTVNDGAIVTFTNEYKVGEATAEIPVVKLLDVAEGLKPGDLTGKFTFTLTAAEGTPMPEVKSYTNPSATGGKVTFGKITFTKPGKYEYTVTETGSADGVTNDPTASKNVIIEVVDNKDGTLTATVNNGKDLEFTNTYKVEPTTVSFPVKKVLSKPEGAKGTDITGKYTFTLAAVTDGAPMPTTVSYTNPDADGGTVTFGEITFKAPGTYEYKVSETGSAPGVTNDPAASSGKTVTVTVVDNGNGTLTATADSTAENPVTFTNSYSYGTTTATPAVHKTLEYEKGLKPADITEQYTFTLEAVTEGAPMPTTDTSVKNPAADGGTASFGTITFEKPGTYEYKVTEEGTVKGITNDPEDKTFKIVVEEVDGTLKATIDYGTDEGHVTFTNTYEATPVSVDPPVQKILEGEGAVEKYYNKGNFTFKIESVSAPEGVTAPMPEKTSIKNIAANELADKPGYYEFGEITFTVPGTYVYKVTESGKAADIANDPSAETGKTLTFVVTDDGEGTLSVTPETDQVELSFTNQYAPKTGDHNNMILYMILMGLAAAVGATSLVILKKKDNKRN